MMRRKNLRPALMAGAVVLLAAPAAFAFFAEAAQDRATSVLEVVRASQERVRFAGRKIVETPEGSAVVDLRADRPGRVHVENVDRSSGRRGRTWAGGGPRGRFSDPSLIAQNYRLDARGSEKIAGRKADRYALLPRHSGRASYEFAVDRENRFLLAFRAVGSDGSRIYDARFESIVFDPAPKPVEKPVKAPGTKSVQERPRRATRERLTEQDLRGPLRGTLSFTVWQPRWTPPGFKLKSFDRYVIPNMGDVVLARWTDGMAGIHVIQTEASNTAWELFRGAYLGLPESPPLASKEGGPVAWRMRHAGGVLLDLTLDGTEVLIGGQAEPDELKKMADHLRNIVE